MEINIVQNHNYESVILNSKLAGSSVAEEIDRSLIDSDAKRIKTAKRMEVTLKGSKALGSQLNDLMDIRKQIQRGKEKFTLRAVENRTNIEFIGTRGDLIDAYKFKGGCTRSNNYVYNSSISEYYESKPGTLYIDIDYKRLFSGIIIELLGEDVFEDIEETLDDCGIVGASDSDKLIDLGWISDDLEDYKGTIVGDSEYILNKRTGFDYFLEPHDIDGTFDLLIDKTREKLRCFILDGLYRMANNCQVRCSLIDISNTGFSLELALNNRGYKFIDEIRRPVKARIFGRKFCFRPNINVIERR